MKKKMGREREKKITNEMKRENRKVEQKRAKKLNINREKRQVRNMRTNQEKYNDQGGELEHGEEIDESKADERLMWVPIWNVLSRSNK